MRSFRSVALAALGGISILSLCAGLAAGQPQRPPAAGKQFSRGWGRRVRPGANPSKPHEHAVGRRLPMWWSGRLARGGGSGGHRFGPQVPHVRYRPFGPGMGRMGLWRGHPGGYGFRRQGPWAPRRAFRQGMWRMGQWGRGPLGPRRFHRLPPRACCRPFGPWMRRMGAPGRRRPGWQAPRMAPMGPWAEGRPGCGGFRPQGPWAPERRAPGHSRPGLGRPGGERGRSGMRAHGQQKHPGPGRRHGQAARSQKEGR